MTGTSMNRKRNINALLKQLLMKKKNLGNTFAQVYSIR